MKVFKAEHDSENMCDTCQWCISECCSSIDALEFGSGEGQDNVIQCDQYSGDQYEEVEL